MKLIMPFIGLDINAIILLDPSKPTLRNKLRSTDTPKPNASPHGTFPIRVSGRYASIRVSQACPDFPDLKRKKTMTIRGGDGGDTPGTREEPSPVDAHEAMSNPNPSAPRSLSIYSITWQGLDRAPPLLPGLDLPRRHCCLDSISRAAVA